MVEISYDFTTRYFLVDFFEYYIPVIELSFQLSNKKIYVTTRCLCSLNHKHHIKISGFFLEESLDRTQFHNTKVLQYLLKLRVLIKQEETDFCLEAFLEPISNRID